MRGPDLDAFVARCADDPRILGAARLADDDATRVRIVLATTWDGLRGIAADLPDWLALLTSLDGAAVAHRGESIDSLAESGLRVGVVATRMADLSPDGRGVRATAIYDPEGLVAQWAAWSAGRKPPEADDELRAWSAAHGVLSADDALRALSELEPGAVAIRGDGDVLALRHVAMNRLRDHLRRLEGPGADTLRERAGRQFASVPLPGAGIRMTCGGDVLERFLAAADAEGYAGDRILFNTAAEHLTRLCNRDAVFEEGFTLASFDKVEGRFAVGDAVGGCKPPLVPCIVVGVEINRFDDLELWAAPAIREPHATVACVSDTADRITIQRTGGAAALIDAVTASIDEAHEALPTLLAKTRIAGRETLTDPAAAIAGLHIPKTFAAAAARMGATRNGITRLNAALLLARAGEEMQPAVARRFGRAAGMLLAGASGDDGGCGT